MMFEQCCIKYFRKVFQLQITNYIFKEYFKYFSQLLWKMGQNTKVHLAEIIKAQNTFN